MGDQEPSAVTQAKEVRRRIDELLDEYTGLAARMSEFEDAFMTYVLLPGYQLQLAVKKRDFLEKEYNRIGRNVRSNAYSSREEIAREVRQAFSCAEVEFSGRELADKDDGTISRSPLAGLDTGDQDLDLTDEEKATITGEFKRTVILKVHADTSDAPFEEFNSVLGAYKKKDFLLMKAFIIRYSGEIARAENESEEDFIERVVRGTTGDGEVLRKLTARIDNLKRNMTSQELESRDNVLSRLKTQNREIQKAIYKEAEELLRLQNLLEGLIKTGLTVH